jgi:hypothetical protein
MAFKFNPFTGKLDIAGSGGGGSGTVTSITAGTGLTGGTITTSGTIAVNPVYSLEIHVSKDGNDTTGDGTLLNPVLTITKALTLVGAGRNTVIVHPGGYTENLTVTSTNTTIATSGLTGANTLLTGTLTLNAAARVSGLKMSNLTIAGSALDNAYISNCTVDTQVIKSGSNYVEIINSELQCTAGIQITGSGIVSIVGNKCWGVAVSNASASVLIKDCFQVITPSVTAGSLQFDGCAIFASAPTTNAVTSSAGTNITLANSFVLNSATNNVERVSLGGNYSILNLVYDKANSTLTGTNLNAVDYFSVINAEKIGVNTVADATVGLKLDSTGVKFNDGTIQTTAAAAITTGSVDNAVLRANGTGGATLQNSGLIVEDTIESFAVTGVASTDIITATGSAFANGQPVRFTALTGGSGLVTTTNYYVINVSGATFQVSTSVGGAASLFTTDITAGTLLTGHSVSTNVTISENTTATNSDLVLTAKGTGAFIVGPKPDGTSTGGSARGTRAVDLQIEKNNANQVASGTNSVIGGGRFNRNTGTLSVVGGGSGNINLSNYSVICGGDFNSTSSAYGGFLGVICGGQLNSNTSRQAFIGGGCRNNISADSGVICGGGGQGNNNGNNVSGVLGAILAGNGGRADRYGMQAHASGQFSNVYPFSGGIGDAQRSRFVLRCKTTTNTGVEMALDGATAYLGIPSGKVMAMTINISGVKSDGTAVAHYVRQYAVKNVAGTSSQVYAPVTIGSDNATGTSIALSANDADDTLRILVTGIVSETWRWVASVDAVEIIYGL